MTTVYIDESGHSGDMINSGSAYDFKGQPYFALAGIGLEDGHDWDDRINELRNRHRIPAGELKSKSLTAKPRFSAELIHALLNQHAPLFIEVVDKRFFICTSITSFQLFPPCLGYPESVQFHFIKNTVADFLSFHAGDIVRDVMLAAVEHRFGQALPTNPIEWLTDNGASYVARHTRAFALDIGLQPLTTPVCSPQSNGMAESFVKTMKRDYIAFMPKPDARTAIANLGLAFEHYNEHPPIVP